MTARGPLLGVLRLALVAGAILVVTRSAEGASPVAEAKITEQKKATQERLQELSKNLDARRAALKDLDNQERSLLLTLSDLDKAIAEVLDERDRARRRIEQLKAEMARLKEKIDADEAAYAHVERRLQRRLRALYVMGEGGAVRHLLGAESFEDLAYRKKLLSRLAKADTRLVTTHARMRLEIEQHRQALARAVEDAQLIELELGQQAKLLAQTRTERQAAIARIEEEKELGVRHVKEIVAQQQEVRALLLKLEAEARKAGRPPRRGKLARLSWPVKGPVLRAFGVTRDAKSGAKLVSNGIHIRAKLGQPVAAPADARVSFTGWLRGFGRIVILEHDEGVHTLLAHLSRSVVETGDAVAAGQTVGFVGDTESTDGAKLYLEVRQHGRPKDPQPFLR